MPARRPFSRGRLRRCVVAILFSAIAGISFADEAAQAPATKDVHLSHDGGAPQATTAPSESKSSWYYAKFDHDMHDMGNSHHAMHQHRTWEPAHALDPASVPGFQLMYEFTQYPTSDKPTAAQQRQADELFAKCLESAKRHGWYDFKKASRSGFKRMFGDQEHYVNDRFVTDDAILDPDRPEFLMFDDVGGEKRLTAFMFLARRTDEHGPQVGGPLTAWHVHLWRRARCLMHGLYPIGDPDEDGLCKEGSPGNQSPEMLHVWLLGRPEDRFATHMMITPEIKAELGRQPTTP